MSFDLNKVLMTGRLGRKPELKKSTAGTPYARMSLATHGPRRQNQEPNTQWHQILVWGAQAEHCHQYLDKGSPILVEGYLDHRSYVADGVKRTTHHIHAHRIQFLGGRTAGDVAEVADQDLDEAVSQLGGDSGGSQEVTLM